MRMDDMILVSVDDHIVEPPDLFERHLSAKYKDIAPRIEHMPNGTDVWRFLDFDIPNVGLNAVSGRPPEEYGLDPTSFDELRPGTYDVKQRVLDMSANGVLGSMNFPSLPGFAGRLFAALDDKDAALALCHAYNDWHIEEWCGSAPDRFIPLAIPPIWDPAALADEVHRVDKMGCHAITFPENPVPLGLPSLHSDHWDPFWRACNDTGTIVNMHIGSSSKLVVTAVDAPVDVMMTLSPMNIVQAATDLIFSPVWKKFPDVTVALSEGGIGWIPYFLERLDHTYTTHKAWTFADFGDKLPSQVFMERVILCFIEDDFGARHAREIGTSRICIETDYPHSDAIWPNAPERLMQGWAPTDLTDREIDEMTHENAMRFFRFDPFSIRPREKCTVGALRAEAVGHDVSIQSKGKRVERDGPMTMAGFVPTA
ncbi:MAG TPA: amidohydrolase family protein [Acidimicrobiia bacterium]|jgi:predicted TIM-barrel fold metal-dependent hydrolase|nr:amidohydrolase family protein [Acidimicrobiia bacterium]